MDKTSQSQNSDPQKPELNPKQSSLEFSEEEPSKKPKFKDGKDAVDGASGLSGMPSGSPSK